MLVTSALKEECVVVVMASSVLMLMLCSFLQFEICGALEYLISHLITPGQLSRDTPYQGRGWNFVKIFSISERLTQQWNVSLWNYINSHHYVGAVCFLQSVPCTSLNSLVTFSAPWQFACEAAPVWAAGGPWSVWAGAGHQSCRVTGRRLARASHPVSSRHPA